MNDEELGRVLKALSDPNRRRILELLAAHEPRESGINCSRIIGQMTVSQPTVSHHMKELANAGLITMTPHGNEALLALRPDTLNTLLAALRERFTSHQK